MLFVVPLASSFFLPAEYPFKMRNPKVKVYSINPQGRGLKSTSGFPVPLRLRTYEISRAGLVNCMCWLNSISLALVGVKGSSYSYIDAEYSEARSKLFYSLLMVSSWSPGNILQCLSNLQ